MNGQRRFSAGLYAGPYTRWLLPEEPAFSPPAGISDRSGALPGYRLGAAVGKPLNERWSIRTGIGWQSTGLRYIVDGLRFGTDLGGTTSRLVHTIRFHSLALPVDLVWQRTSRKEKLNYRAGLGVSVERLFRSRSERVIRHTQIPDEILLEDGHTLSSYSFGGGLFFGLEWVLSEKAALAIEPGCRAVRQSLRLDPFATASNLSLEPGLTTRLRLF